MWVAKVTAQELVRVLIRDGYRCRVRDARGRACMAPAGRCADVEGSLVTVCLRHLSK